MQIAPERPRNLKKRRVNTALVPTPRTVKEEKKVATKHRKKRKKRRDKQHTYEEQEMGKRKDLENKEKGNR